MTNGHGLLIAAAYAVTAVSLLALVVWTWADHRRQTKLLADLESRRGARAE